MRNLGEAVEVPNGVLAALRLEPNYFDDLAETTARFLRRPRDAQRILRYLEWWAQAQIGLDGPPAASLGVGYGDYTRKLASDLARTCFKAAGLGREWMKLADEAGNRAGDVGAEITDGVAVTSAETAATPSEGGGATDTTQRGEAQGDPQLRLP